MNQKKLIPLYLLITAASMIYFFELHLLFSLTSLQKHYKTLKNIADTHPIQAPIFYILLYTFSTALSIPGAIFLTLLGGFLFTQPFATVYVVTGATLGATSIFLIAKSSFGEFFSKKGGKTLQKMEKGFQEGAVSYLLFLRLVPLFPFWLVNIAPAFFRVSLFTYIWTTIIGILPAAFAYTQAGYGLATFFDSYQESNESLSIDQLLSKEIKLALFAIAFIAIIPVIYRIKKLYSK